MNQLTRVLYLALQDTYLPHTSANGSNLRTIVQYVFGVAGAVALLMIVIGAFQYTISRGDPTSTNRARSTIIYAVVGLVICLAAYSIVTFVIGRI